MHTRIRNPTFRASYSHVDYKVRLLFHTVGDGLCDTLQRYTTYLTDRRLERYSLKSAALIQRSERFQPFSSYTHLGLKLSY